MSSDTRCPMMSQLSMERRHQESLRNSHGVIVPSDRTAVWCLKIRVWTMSKTGMPYDRLFHVPVPCHWNRGVMFPTLSSLVSPEAVFMTAYGVINDHRVGIMTTLGIQWSYQESCAKANIFGPWMRLGMPAAAAHQTASQTDVHNQFGCQINTNELVKIIFKRILIH